jgi:hypothetical protein
MLIFSPSTKLLFLANETAAIDLLLFIQLIFIAFGQPFSA